MKKVTNNDLIRKLDFNQPAANPAYVSNIKTISDQGFRSFIAEVIIKDEERKSLFMKKIVKKD